MSDPCCINIRLADANDNASARVITALILAGALVGTLTYALIAVQAALLCWWQQQALGNGQPWQVRATKRGNAVPLPPVFHCSVLCCGPRSVCLIWGCCCRSAFLGRQCVFVVSHVAGPRYHPAGQGIWQLVIVRAFLGLAILSSTWLAVVTCFIMSNGVVVFAMIPTVAAADVGAYFVGRRFGRRPPWPNP